MAMEIPKPWPITAKCRAIVPHWVRGRRLANSTKTGSAWPKLNWQALKRENIAPPVHWRRRRSFAGRDGAMPVAAAPAGVALPAETAATLPASMPARPTAALAAALAVGEPAGLVLQIGRAAGGIARSGTALKISGVARRRIASHGRSAPDDRQQPNSCDARPGS